MLSRGYADLVRRDRALPGLATLLDPDKFLASMRSAFPDAEIEHVRPIYLRYKPFVNCLVHYQAGIAGKTVPVHAKTFGVDVSAKLQKPRGKAQSTLGAGCVALEDINALFYVFPNDNNLPALGMLADTASREHLLRRALKDQPQLWDSTLHALRYKPERRYVARLETAEGTQAVLKFYAKAEFQPAFAAARRLASKGPLQIAPLCGKSNRKRILAFKWLPGVGLADLVERSDATQACLSRIGGALAAFHKQKANGLKVARGRASELALLRSQATVIGQLCPHFAARAVRVAERIAGQLVNVPTEHCPVHGDFNDKQILLTDDSVAILDLDEVALGDRAYDLGLFISHLERYSLDGHLKPRVADRLAEAFVESYGAASGRTLPAHIDLYAAFGLVQLAVEPFRTFDPQWPDKIEAMLARAEAVLGWAGPAATTY